jgi:hypothetical protein
MGARVEQGQAGIPSVLGSRLDPGGVVPPLWGPSAAFRIPPGSIPGREDRPPGAVGERLR